MYLKSLTLKGFKSFASSTTLKLEPGICAVVGPNGSGKSNVVDALAWVMGEQGAKTLRGGSMDDVIFAGAGERKPLGRAEVTLTIDNSDGALPIDYSEVSITRRVFRDGGSEYEINGTKARLMDIQELLSDSGIGREMHVIVGQGRLASILESKPEDRRAYIEEAAGVLKHRRRKDKAQRKLVAMQTNLDRLQDLTGELERQLKPLARQAEAAQRAATVQSDLREARLNLAADTLVTVREEYRQLSQRAEEAAATAETLAEENEQLEAERDELEDLLAQLTPQAEEAQKMWFRLSSLAERINATQRIARDRADAAADDSAGSYHGPDPDELEARAIAAQEHEEELLAAVEEAAERLETIRESVAEKEERASIAEKEHLAAMRAIADRREGVTRLEAAEESAQQRLESAHQDAERAGEALAALEPVIAEAEADMQRAQEAAAKHEGSLAEVTSRAEDAARELAGADKRLAELRAAERDHEREISALESRIETLAATARPSNGAEWVRTHTSLVAGRLADEATAERGWEIALAAALGAAAEAMTIKENTETTENTETADGDIAAALTELSEAGAGRAWLVAPSTQASWRLQASLPANCSWLLDKLTIQDRYQQAITSLLVDVVAVPSVEVGQQLVRDDARLRAVTQDGILMGAGWAAAGSGAVTAVEVNAAVQEAKEHLTTQREALEALSGTIAGAEAAANERRDSMAAARAAKAEFTAVSTTLKDRVRQAEATVERAHKEKRRALADRSQAEARIDNIRTELGEIAQRRAHMEADAESTGEEPSTAARDSAHEELTQVRAMEVEARLALRVAEERASGSRGRAEALRRQAEHERAARARFEQAQRRRRDARDRAAHVAEWCEKVAERVAQALEIAAANRDGLQARTAEVTAQRGRARDAVSAAAQQLSRAQQVSHDADVKREAARVRSEQSEAHIIEQLGLNPEDLLRTQDLTDFDRAAEEKRLASAERALKSLGKVNPLALEEFKALEERYSFLSTQLMDVQKAREDLRGVIQEVDATILQLFTDAWHDVQAQFPAVFETLFPGGEGRLTLTDPDDMLTTGIEVHARPPGKRVTRLSLLSGGEKSLTALALLVSIFRARPSPFYVMDEVEAALDDVNLRRLIALFEQLRDDSQLIVITHQKPTMDIANVLYGVTMRGDGVTRVISQRMSPHTMPATEAEVTAAQTGEPS